MNIDALKQVELMKASGVSPEPLGAASNTDKAKFDALIGNNGIKSDTLAGLNTKNSIDKNSTAVAPTSSSSLAEFQARWREAFDRATKPSTIYADHLASDPASSSLQKMAHLEQLTNRASEFQLLNVQLQMTSQLSKTAKQVPDTLLRQQG